MSDLDFQSQLKQAQARVESARQALEAAARSLMADYSKETEAYGSAWPELRKALKRLDELEDGK